MEVPGEKLNCGYQLQVGSLLFRWLAILVAVDVCSYSSLKRQQRSQATDRTPLSPAEGYLHPCGPNRSKRLCGTLRFRFWK
jgi:hypothetical protein